MVITKFISSVVLGCRQKQISCTWEILQVVTPQYEKRRNTTLNLTVAITVPMNAIQAKKHT
jgi:hypothetical protein